MGKFLPHAAPSNQAFELYPPNSRKITGSLVNKPRLLPRAPFAHFHPLHLRLRRCPPPDGLLELRHLRHDLLGRRADVIQR